MLLTQRYRAETLLELKRTREASEALDAYLAGTSDPDPTVLRVRGMLHAQKGELPAAIDAYSAALRLAPRLSEMPNADKRLSPRDFQTKLHGERGWAYLEIGAVRLGLEDFQACLREAPDSADYLTGRATAQVRLRQWQEALDDAAAAEKRGSLSPELLYYLSCVYAQAAGQKGLEGRWEAIRWLSGIRPCTKKRP